MNAYDEDIVLEDSEQEDIEVDEQEEQEEEQEQEEQEEEQEEQEQEEEKSITDEQWEEIQESIHKHLDEALQSPEELLKFMKPDFPNDLISETTHIIFEGLVLSEICTESDEYIIESIKEMVESTLDFCMDILELPKRQEVTNPGKVTSSTDISKIQNKIQFLKSIKQPVQKSKEWYESRHNLITASNLYKALSSEANINSLIYEKCKPFNSADDRSTGYTNTMSPMHWGTKYEALTVALYELKNNTSIDEFGCIPHSKYPFIGASPDGINADLSSPLFGRMLEIKNIVNREIDGIPSEAYWTQMQIQMETCGLDECDFAETRFKEYSSEQEFWEDDTKDISQGEKGLVLYFVRRDCSPVPPLYKFSPLNFAFDFEKQKQKSEINKWVESAKEEVSEEWILYETNYWYLDEYSCVLVKRNQAWFEAAIPHIRSVWEIILKERVDGYEHRAPKKKPAKPIVTEAEDSKIVTITQNSPLPIVKLG
jgi:putative phage-type endonuclease